MDLSHPRCGQYGRKPKSGLPLRPVFHRLPQRIQVCVWITALALPLERGGGAVLRVGLAQHPGLAGADAIGAIVGG